MKAHFLHKADDVLSQNGTLMLGTLYFHHCKSRAIVMKYDLTYIFKHDIRHHSFIDAIIFSIKITSAVDEIAD